MCIRKPAHQIDSCHPYLSSYIRSFGIGKRSIVASLSQYPPILADLKKSKINIDEPEIAATVEEDCAIIPCVDEYLILLATGWKDTAKTRRMIQKHGPWCLYVCWGLFEHDQDTIQLVRLRPTKPISWEHSPENKKRAAEGKPPKTQKYLTRKGDTNYPFYPRSAPRLPSRFYPSPESKEVQCIWTEGEKKAISSWYHTGIPTLGAIGVYGHRIKDENTAEKLRAARKWGHSRLHPDDHGEVAPFMRQIDWKQLRPVIMYDSDLASNKNVTSALHDLIRRLHRLDCPEVRTAFIPEDAQNPASKVGLDDLLMQHNGEQRLCQLFESATIARNDRLFDSSSTKSKHHWQMERSSHGRRFAACDDCLTGDHSYACQTCGKNLGVTRPYRSGHCPLSSNQILVHKENPLAGAIMNTCCHAWDCTVCGFRQESAARKSVLALLHLSWANTKLCPRSAGYRDQGT